MDQQILDDVSAMLEDTFFTESFQNVNGATDETLKILFDVTSEIVFDPNPIESGSLQILLKTADMTNVDRDSVFTRLADSVVYYPIRIGKDQHGTTLIDISLDIP